MRKLIKKVLILIKPYWKQELIGVILTILFTVTVYLIPKASQYLIDDVIPTKSYKILTGGLLLFASICIAQPVISFYKDKIFLSLTEKITFNIRKVLFNKIIHSEFGFLDNAKGGDLISIIMNDGRGASDFISKIFAILLKNGLLIIMILIGMLLLSYQITLVVVSTFIAFYSISLLFGKRLRALSKNVQINYDEICTFINQTNNSIVTIKSNRQEEQAEKKYQEIIAKMKKNNMEMSTLRISISNVTSVAVVLCLTVIYGWGALKVMEEILSLGQVVALGLYFQLLEQPFFELLNIGINTNVTIPIFERIEIYEKLKAEELGENKGRLEFNSLYIDNLRFRYKEDEDEVIRGLTLELPQKGLVSITGESGSGKTTFVKLLLGMYRITSGDIRFGETSINDISLNTLRNNISYVPQSPEILNDTIMNNILYGNKHISEKRVIELCRLLKLHDKIMSLPNGYDSVVTEKVNLSGGEKQRIAIARAVLKDTPIMIFDEPLSALDPENTEIVKDVIYRISNDKLALVISHYGYDTIQTGIKVTFSDGYAIEEKYEHVVGI